MDSTAITFDTCILCQQAEGRGTWQLCDGCRSNLIRQSGQRQRMMAPDHCLGCFTPRRQPPMPGQLYCPDCQQRFRMRV